MALRYDAQDRLKHINRDKIGDYSVMEFVKGRGWQHVTITHTPALKPANRFYLNGHEVYTGTNPIFRLWNRFQLWRKLRPTKHDRG